MGCRRGPGKDSRSRARLSRERQRDGVERVAGCRSLGASAPINLELRAPDLEVRGVAREPYSMGVSNATGGEALALSLALPLPCHASRPACRPILQPRWATIPILA